MTRIGIDAYRLEAALRLSDILECEETAESIQNRIFNLGLGQAIIDLNERWGLALSAGPFAVYSYARDRYWSRDHGWITDVQAASGFTDSESRHLAPDQVCGTLGAVFIRRPLFVPQPALF